MVSWRFPPSWNARSGPLAVDLARGLATLVGAPGGLASRAPLRQAVIAARSRRADPIRAGFMSSGPRVPDVVRSRCCLTVNLKDTREAPILLGFALVTPSELLAALPNGFHDAFLRDLRIDFTRGEARLHLEFWVGDLDASDETLREARRSGVLLLTGLASMTTEPPGSGCRFSDEDGLWVDGGFGAYPGDPPPPDDGLLRLWLFVETWNARMTFTCTGLAVAW
jgi:hypothetical protein